MTTLKLDLKEIVLIGRTFDEYCRMFALNDELLSRSSILDVASGVSSFCAEGAEKEYHITASDRIYQFSPVEIEQKCSKDLDTVIGQMPRIANLFLWDYFRDISALKDQREKAYTRFVQDYEVHGTGRYRSVDYPVTPFKDKEFDLALVSHFLFLYEEQLDYDFHKRTLQELIRISRREIRIFPIVKLNGEHSSYVERLMDDYRNLAVRIEKVPYEFMKNGNEMLVISLNEGGNASR